MKFKIFLIVVVFGLFGCMDKKPAQEEEGGGRYGMMSGDSADMAALKFFDAIYNDNDMDVALYYATDRMSRLLKSYHTPKAVARHIINLRYEGKVIMEIDAGDTVGRQEFATKQRVSVYFSGHYQGDLIDELRTVQMLREDGEWRVDSILTDKFL
ncbi:MAG: hypothetical protein ACFHVJ_12715 [Aestuariibacter sp.]